MDETGSPPFGHDAPPRAVPAGPPPPPPARTTRRRRGCGSTLLRLVLVLLVVGFLGVGLVFLVGSLFLRAAPHVEQGTWLEVRFSANYPEQRPDRTGLSGALTPTDLSAQDLLTALRRAGSDPRIAGVLLRPDGFPGGWAQARELHERLREMQENGTRVVAYVEDASSLGTYLATAARSVVVAPEGMLRPVGLQARLTFLRGTLDKIGASADFVAIGEYKSAPEQLQSETASEPSRQQVAAYLDDVYAAWIASLAEDRGLTRERVRMLVDRGMFDAEEAVSEGLADLVADHGELWSRIRIDEDDPPVLNVLEYLAATGRDGSGPAIAVVHVTGTIVSGTSGSGGWNGSVAGSETVVERLRRAREDDRVYAVVLRVDSPGGSALASDVIYRELLRLKREKPVVVSMANLAASGGYYVSMGGDRIVADPLTLTGSIGVYTGKVELSGLYEKLGLGFETFQRGDNADLFSDLRRFRPEQRQRIRLQLEGFYSRFVSRVAEGRDMEFDAVDEIARGRVWSGERAVENGLVDELGTLDDALRVARTLARGDDDGTPIRVVTYQPEPGFYEAMLQGMFGPEGISVGRSTPAERAVERAAARWLGPWVAALQTLDGSFQYHLAWMLEVD